MKFGFHDLVFFLIQLPLVILCGWLLAPLPGWLETHHSWSEAAAGAVTAGTTASLWIPVVALFGAVRSGRGRRGERKA